MKRKKNRTKQQETPTKMSEILLKYAWSYAIQDVEDPQLRQEFMDVACFAWNFSLLPEEDCNRAIVNYINNRRASVGVEVDEANIQALTNDLYALVEHKRKQYPTIKKLVVSTEVFDDGENVRCRAVSTDYDAMVKANQLK
jgi:hypothetical protein